ncbi:hypothetical protein HDU91_007015 [Kappamyces sp. JEL0680]|nr:hypothetical protein HDU91_007015 [Kappamyces sp. JEL0680]
MIFLEVGQAGIQGGQTLFSRFELENGGESLRYPFNMADQLLIDTERKVWKRVQRRSPNRLFSCSYLDHGVCGRGNNWAFGYFGEDGGSRETDDILEEYRRMAEASYKYDGVCLVHSVAGGTGSGLGSRLVQEIRQEYGKGAIMTVSFAPFASGETAVQSYNTLLSLHSLQQCADFIGYFPNDVLLACVERDQSSAIHGNQKQTAIQLQGMNEYAASCLAGLFLPQTPVAYSSTGHLEFQSNLARFDALALIYNLTPMPSCKYSLFASSMGGPPDKRVSYESWDDLASNALRNTPIVEPDRKRTCLAAQLNIRGVQGSDLFPRLAKITARWQSKLGVPVLDPVVNLSHTYGLDVNQKRSVDTVFNSNSILSFLEPVLERSHALYEQRAYLHWYERYAGPDTHALFAEAFESLHQTVDDYGSLSEF